MPSLSEFLFGSKPKTDNINILTPDQQSALQRFFSQGIEKSPLYGSGSSYIQNLLSGSPEAFSAFEAPLMQQFNQQIVPGIAERFAGMGTGAGAGSSSALYNSLAQAGRNLSTDIGGLRAGLQMQALPQALGYSQQPFNNLLSGLNVRAQQTNVSPGRQGFFPSLFGGIGAGFAGPFGSLLGGSLGQGLTSLFGGR
jgi:hypothetical protein